MITVLMAVYNGEKYLREQLDSILHQENPPEFQVIVSDDCSGDGSRQIIREYEQKYPKLVKGIYREKPSGGAEHHFLQLLSEADGRYVMLSDQDDVWLPEKMRLLYNEIQKMEEKWGNHMPILLHSDMEVVDEDKNRIADSYFTYQKISPERTKLCQELVQNNVTGGAVIMNQAMLSYFKQIPSVCLMHDSWIALVAACFGKIGCMNRPLYLYRQHGSNSLGARKADTLEEGIERIADGGKARENYRRMFGQAKCLLQIYGRQMKESDRKTVEAFLSLQNSGRLRKIKIMLSYGFTKNTWFRTLGQMMFM